MPSHRHRKVCLFKGIQNGIVDTAHELLGAGFKFQVGWARNCKALSSEHQRANHNADHSCTLGFRKCDGCPNHSSVVAQSLQFDCHEWCRTINDWHYVIAQTPWENLPTWSLNFQEVVESEHSSTGVIEQTLQHTIKSEMLAQVHESLKVAFAFTWMGDWIACEVTFWYCSSERKGAVWMTSQLAWRARNISHVWFYWWLSSAIQGLLNFLGIYWWTS